MEINAAAPTLGRYLENNYGCNCAGCSFYRGTGGGDGPRAYTLAARATAALVASQVATAEARTMLFGRAAPLVPVTHASFSLACNPGSLARSLHLRSLSLSLSLSLYHFLSLSGSKTLSLATPLTLTHYL